MEKTIIIPPYSYQDFQTANLTLGSDAHGPWTATVTTPHSDNNSSRCYSDTCGTACIRCNGFDDYDTDTFATLAVNISVDMSEHKNATRVSFTWTFWPSFCGERFDRSYSLPIESKVGDVTFSDTIRAMNCNETGRAGSEQTHEASNGISLSSDGVNGFIPITIKFGKPILWVNNVMQRSDNFTYYLNRTSFTIDSFDVSVPSRPDMGWVGGAVVGIIFGIGLLAMLCIILWIKCTGARSKRTTVRPTLELTKAPSRASAAHRPRPPSPRAYRVPNFSESDHSYHNPPVPSTIHGAHTHEATTVASEQWGHINDNTQSPLGGRYRASLPPAEASWGFDMAGHVQSTSVESSSPKPRPPRPLPSNRGVSLITALPDYATPQYPLSPAEPSASFSTDLPMYTVR